MRLAMIGDAKAILKLIIETNSKNIRVTISSGSQSTEEGQEDRLDKFLRAYSLVGEYRTIVRDQHSACGAP